jgi:CRP-like cAMP-binding protein
MPAHKPAALPPSIEKLAEAGVKRSYKKKSIIISEGDSGDTVFILLEGSVRVFGQEAQGREVTYGQIDAPSYFGEMSLDGGQHRSHYRLPMRRRHPRAHQNRTRHQPRARLRADHQNHRQSPRRHRHRAQHGVERCLRQIARSLRRTRKRTRRARAQENQNRHNACIACATDWHEQGDG